MYKGLHPIKSCRGIKITGAHKKSRVQRKDGKKISSKENEITENPQFSKEVAKFSKEYTLPEIYKPNY